MMEFITYRGRSHGGRTLLEKMIVYFREELALRNIGGSHVRRPGDAPTCDKDGSSRLPIRKVDCSRDQLQYR
jgi:hypothetical protein